MGNEDVGDKATVMTTHSDAHVEVSAGTTYFFFYKRRIVVSIEVIINVHIRTHLFDLNKLGTLIYKHFPQI